jgi:hypothetical protein
LKYLREKLHFGSELTSRPSRDVYKSQGFKSRADFVEYLLWLINDDKVETTQNANKEYKAKQDATKALAKAKREATRKKKLAITMDAFNTIVNDTDGPGTGKTRQAFHLQCKSAVNSEIIVVDQLFKNIYHYQGWYNNFKAGEHDYISYGANVLDKPMNISELVTYELGPVQGGANESHNLKEFRVIDGFHCTFQTKQIRVRDKNCGVECVKDILNLNVSCAEMRKSINSEAKSLISIEDV